MKGAFKQFIARIKFIWNSPKKLREIQNELHRVGGMPVRHLVDGFLRLLKENNEKDPPPFGFKTWEDYLYFIVALKAEHQQMYAGLEVMQDQLKDLYNILSFDPNDHSKPFAKEAISLSLKEIDLLCRHIQSIKPPTNKLKELKL